MIPTPAALLFPGADGAPSQPVLVVGETPKRYRIRATQRTTFAGQSLSAGTVALVPKTAVRIEPRPHTIEDVAYAVAAAADEAQFELEQADKGAPPDDYARGHLAGLKEALEMLVGKDAAAVMLEELRGGL